MLIHIPRVFCALARGMLRPHPRGGLPGDPHIYTARVNPLLDVDQYLHMNNASYSVHFEMARWEMAAANGLATSSLANGIAYIVASHVTSFRREIRPLQAFEIHSEYVLADDKQVHILQLARSPGDDRILAGSLVRGVLRKGRDVVSPRELLSRVCGDAQLPSAHAWGDELDALAMLERRIRES